MGSFYLGNSTNSVNFYTGTANNFFRAGRNSFSDIDTSIFTFDESSHKSSSHTFKGRQYDSFSEDKLSSAKNNLRAFINGQQNIWS